MTKKVVLVIEDEPELNHIFSLVLQDEFQVESVGDGQAAVLLLSSLVPDLIVLDMHLPNMPGDQVLSFIRGNKQLNETKVILATADTQRAERLKDVADLVLLKPISPTQLLELAMRITS